MKRVFTFLILTSLLFSQNLFSNGLSLNSIGPRALGMGGAMVGLADDATAIYWNPAGLINQKGTYVGIFSTSVTPMPSYKYEAAGIDAEGIANNYISPNLIANWNCLLTDKLKISLGAYVPAGLGAEWDGEDLKNLSNGQVFEWESKIAVFNISPAISYSILPNLSVGAALNVYYGMFDLKRAAVTTMQGQTVAGQYDESSDGLGYGFTLGLLYSPIKKLSIGATFRSKTGVQMSGTANNALFAALQAPSTEFDREVSWPMWIAGGIAYKPTDKLTIAFDVQFSQWSEAVDEFVTEYENTTWQAATEPTEANIFKLHWIDATQIRFGAEYLLTDAFAVRAGFYHDPAPAPDETYNLLFPDITYKGITFGSSYKIKKFTFDLGLEYLIGEERDIAPATDQFGLTNVPGLHNCNIFAISLGVGYLF